MARLTRMPRLHGPLKRRVAAIEAGTVKQTRGDVSA
jgi:hypothetical protein